MANVDQSNLALKLAKILMDSAYRDYYSKLIERYVSESAARRRPAASPRPGDPKAAIAPAKQNAVKFAEASVARAFGEKDTPSLQYPVAVHELVADKGPIYLYRAFDGVTAFKQSNWWSSAELVRDITSASPSRNESGGLKHRQVLDFMLSSCFVHPSWNTGMEVACMKIPAGMRAPVIIGAGDWQAMKKETKVAKTMVTNEGDVIDKLGMLPIPGPAQVFVTLYQDDWITTVPQTSPKWPFE